MECSSRSLRQKSPSRSSRKALGPSESACSGRSCTSTKMPSTPAATAARASGLDELRLAAGGRARAAGQLHAVGGVEDHRPAGIAHDLQAAHVHHQVVVAEGRAALGQHHLAVAGGGHLLRGAADIVRRHELALLDVDDAAGAAGGQQQVRLAAEERGDLQDVRHLGRRFGLRRLVDVGEDGKALGLHAGQDAQAFAQARTAISAARWCGWPCRRRL